MVEESKGEKQLLKEGNWFSRFFFLHLNKICDLGGERPYQVQDLFRISGELCTIAFRDVKSRFEETDSSDRGYLIKIMLTVKKYMLGGGLNFAYVNFVQILSPVFINYFLDWISNPRAEIWKGYVYAAVLSIILYNRAFASQHAMQFLHEGAVIMNNYVG